VWTSQTLAGLPGLSGVWVAPGGEATAVGVRGAAIRVAPGGFVVTRQRTGEALVLHAVWGEGARRWAVGGSLDSAPPWEGLILGWR